MSKTVAILLAAGESRRMGELKALLSWQGTSLLAHQLDALEQAGIQQVIVVLGHRVEDLMPVLERRERVTVVLNPDYLQGKTTSIKAGLGAVSRHNLGALLVLNVDQPRSAETIRCLVQRHRSGGVLITIPTYQGKGGHPIILDPSLMEELLSINEATQGMKALVQRHLDQAQRVEMDHPEVLWDLNTPEEYRQALGR